MKLTINTTTNRSFNTVSSSCGRYAWRCKQAITAKPKGIKSNMNNVAIAQQK